MRWPAVVAATVLVLFGSVLGSDQTLAFRDTDRLYAPMRSLVDGAVRAGRLPLWNPYECLGKPLFADGIHAVLHPISVAGAWISPASVDFLAVAYLISAALGAFALARGVGATSLASAGAGLTFALSGYVLSMTGNLAFLAGAASFPWIAVAARAAGAGVPHAPAAAALATAVAFFSGDTQGALIGVALGLALAGDAGGVRGVGRAFLGTCAGVLLAGVQILASRAALAEASRADRLAAGEAEQWALAPARILEWIVPGLVRGELARVTIPDVIQGGPLVGSFAESVYLGAPLLVLAFVGIAGNWSDRSTRRTAIVLAAASGLCLWVGLGHHMGARQLLDYVPIWNRFRYTEKLMAPLALCLSVAAALGVDRASRARLPRPVALAMFGLAVLASTALAVVHLAPSTIRQLFGALDDEAAAFLLENLRRGLLHPIAALAALLAADRARDALRPALFALVAVGAAMAALPYGAHLGRQAPHEAVSPFQFDAPPPGARLAHPFERALTPTASLDAVEVSAFYLRLVLTPSVNVERGIDSVDCYGPFWSRRRVMLKDRVGDWMVRAARRFGLTHVVLPPPGNDAELGSATAATAGGRLVESLDEPPLEVWAIPHRPWAFFARQAIAAPSMEAASRIVADLSARGEDETVVVEAPEPPATSAGRIISLARGLEEVRIEAESAGPGLLVVNDAYWSGWRAFVDGRETEILAADLIVRAVRWPAGRHLLVMRYEPAEISVGLAATGVGAIATLALAAPAIAAALRRRRAS